MILKWPEHIFARLLPPPLAVEGSKRYTFAAPYHSSLTPLESDDWLSSTEANIIPSTSEPQEEVLELSPTVSFSDDEGNDVLSTHSSRRVRFDESVQVTTIPKVVKSYPKTPPRRKMEVKETNSNDENALSMERKTNYSSKLSSSATNLTPRRLSLRSARRTGLIKPPNDGTDETKNETNFTKKEEEDVSPTQPVEIAATPRRTPRRKANTTTPRRTSLRSATKSAKISDDEEVEVPTKRTARSKAVTTPLRSARRQSKGDNTWPTKARATKADSLKALSLLGSLPKQTKRDLFSPIQRAKKCHEMSNMPEQMLMLVVDHAPAGELLKFLSEKPATVDTVLNQLRSYEG